MVNSAPATTTGLGNAKFTPENNSNTGSVKITVGTTQEDIPITEQASEVTYQLALDSTGKPYVQVNVKKPDSEVTGTLNEITASWVKMKWTWTGFDGKVGLNYLRDSTETDVPSITEAAASTSTGSGWNKVDADILTDSSKGQAVTSSDDNSPYNLSYDTNNLNKSTWFAWAMDTNTTDTAYDRTGNISVSLSSGLVAVLPVSGGAISFSFFSFPTRSRKNFLR